MSAPKLFDESDSDSDGPPTSSAPAPTTSLGLSSSDEEDEEDEGKGAKRGRDGDDGGGGGSKSKKKSKVMNFMDDEAEAEDEDEKEYTAEQIAAEQMDDDAKRLMREQDRRRQNAAMLGRETNVVETAAAIEERYKAQAKYSSASGGGGFGMGEDDPNGYNMQGVNQQAYMPSVKDPKMWAFKCIPGKEEELCIQIMNKAIALSASGQEIGITGACVGKTKGRVYVEGFSEPHVMQAIQGIRMLMVYTMTIVPINDMISVMDVQSKKKPVKKGQWVRCTRGHFKGDLARVEEVLEDGMKCIVKCVPRLDLTLHSLSAEQAKIRRKNVRPAKRFFNVQDVTTMGGYVGNGRMASSFENYSTYEGNFYDSEGYMVKEMKVGNTVVACKEDTAPTLEELQEFRKKENVGEEGEEGREENDQSLLDELSELQKDFSSQSNTKKESHGILLGDTVKVTEGDLIGMMGKVIFIDETTVKISPTSVGTLELGDVEFLVDQVRKHLEVGKHVKVVDGRYVDETGVIVAVEDFEGEETAILLTDLTAKEISVRVTQLQESADISTGQAKLHGYELYDLVALSGGGSVNEVGVVVRVGKEEFSVITNQGARDVRPEELRGKRNMSSLRAVALDVGGLQIRVGDSVNVIDGVHKNKSATIKHIHKAQLFLHSQQKVEHGGIFIARARTCSLLAGTRQRGEKVVASTNVKFGARKPRADDDVLMTKTVRIQQGQWKGYLGIVVNATETHVMVELHSRLKKVNVLRSKVAKVGDRYGATNNAARDGDVDLNDPSAMNNSGLTPFMGSSTPSHLGGATPMNNGGLTPSGGGGMTPLNASAYGDEDDEENVWIPGGMDGQTPSSANSTSLENGSQSAGWTPTSGGETDGSTPGWTPQEGMTPQSDMGGISTPQGDTMTPESSSTYTPISNMSSVTPVSTPGDNVENAWFTDRVHVKLVGSEDVENFILNGVNVLNNTATCIGEKSGEQRTIKVEDVAEKVEPAQNDRVLVFQGTLVGSEGDLVCIDGNDAIFKNESGDFKIVDVKDVAKIGTAE